MFNFEYYTPTKVVFGKDTVNKIGKLIKKQNCRKVLIHYGGKSAERSGLLAKVKDILTAQQVEYVTLGGVVPNPRLALVYEGIALCRKENVDFILAVGGGSVIDSAKAIAYGATNDCDVWDIFENKVRPAACLPIGTILTIAAAGSEMSNASVITNEKTGAKVGYCNDLARPRFAVMAPELTMTLPDYQTACGCTDILMHTMERYFTNGGNMEVTDALAEGLMRTVMKNALILKDRPQDYDARAEIMWAGSLSHNDLTGCGNDGGDWSTHMLEHEVGGMFDVAHGAGLAAVWGSWARYVYKECLPRFEKFAVNVMGIEKQNSAEETALQGICAMENFYRAIGMPTSLKELGVEPSEMQIKQMAQMCVKAVGGKIGSAKVLKEQDMINIYNMAL